jgi:hypothetical protein
MANSLNVDLDYFSHPKTLRLVGLLGGGAEVLPIKLWAYCGKFHAEHGTLIGYGPSEIESAIGWRGTSGDAVAALLKVHYLDQIDGGYAVHDWVEYQGHIHAYKVRGKVAAMKKWKIVSNVPAKPLGSADATSNALSNANTKTTSGNPEDHEIDNDARNASSNAQGSLDASSNATANALGSAVSIAASNPLAFDPKRTEHTFNSLPGSPGTGESVEKPNRRKTKAGKQTKSEDSPVPKDCCGRAENPFFVFPKTASVLVRTYWNDKWKQVHGTEFPWGSGGTSGTALASIMETLGLKRETPKDPSTSFTTEERLARNAHNMEKMPAVCKVIDAFMANTEKYYEGHPPTKLRQDIHKFNAMANGNGKATNGNGHKPPKPTAEQRGEFPENHATLLSKIRILGELPRTQQDHPGGGSEGGADPFG